MVNNSAGNAKSDGRTYQLAEKVGNPTIRDIGNERIKEECPGHRIQQRLLHLVQLEVLVTDTLLVDPHPRDGEHTVFFLEPPSIQLAVRDNP